MFSVRYSQPTTKLQFLHTPRFMFGCYIDFCVGIKARTLSEGKKGKNPVRRHSFSNFRIAKTFICMQQ